MLRNRSAYRIVIAIIGIISTIGAQAETKVKATMAEPAKATVHLDVRHNVGSIDHRIFGGFLEHIGRAVYEGVYEPGNKLSDESGFRKDVMEAHRKMKMDLVRWPGGNFVSNYDWRDGVAPKEQRPPRADLVWKNIEPNTFGTDEFIAWCRKLGTDPFVIINLGTGVPKDAAEWVEYCNLPGGASPTGTRTPSR